MINPKIAINAHVFFRDIITYKNVLEQLVAQQLILRYRRTVLGFLWTLVNPILMMSVMSLVFSSLFASDIKSFTIFLFSGMVPWVFFSSVTTQSGTSFINNEGLIKKIYLPKIIFPLSISLGLLIDSFVSFFVLFAIMIILGAKMSWSLLFIPFAYINLFFFSFGVGMIMSIITVFFRDLQHIIIIAMQGLFFLTPIFYRQDNITGKLSWIVDMNPVVPFIELFRIPLYLARFPDGSIIIRACILSFVAFFLGLYIFLYQEKKIVFRL